MLQSFYFILLQICRAVILKTKFIVWNNRKGKHTNFTCFVPLKFTEKGFILPCCNNIERKIKKNLKLHTNYNNGRGACHDTLRYQSDSVCFCMRRNLSRIPSCCNYCYNYKTVHFYPSLTMYIMKNPIR